MIPSKEVRGSQGKANFFRMQHIRLRGQETKNLIQRTEAAADKQAAQTFKTTEK